MERTRMKSLRLAALAVAWMLAAASAAWAQDAATIAVVDVQKIMNNSTAAKNAREQVENKQKSFQSEMAKKEEQLQKEEKELGKQRNVLAKDAFEEKYRAYRIKVTEIQKESQAKVALLDNAFQRALNEIYKTVADIIGDLAKEKGFIVAMPAAAT